MRDPRRPKMKIYHTPDLIEWPGSSLQILGGYEEKQDEVEFSVILCFDHPEYSGELVYKSWTRKKFGYFDPDIMLADTSKIDKIVEKFKKMGELQFVIRFRTLQSRTSGST